MRVPTCAECRGACCEEVELTLTPADFFADEWLVARLGPHVKSRCVTRDGKSEVITRLEVRCSKLTADGLCSVHHTVEPDDSPNGAQPIACRIAKVGDPWCLDVVRRRRPGLWELINSGDGEDSPEPAYPDGLGPGPWGAD